MNMKISRGLVISSLPQGKLCMIGQLIARLQSSSNR